jgi:hypothetical protein
MRKVRLTGDYKSIFFTLLMLSTVLFTARSAIAFDHDHSLLTEALGEQVAHGRVNYQALKSNPDRLHAYLRTLAGIDPDDYETWTHQQQLAMWINAYNAYTIKAVIDHYPIDHSWIADPLGEYPDNSIRQIPGVWEDMTWTVMGKQYTLNKMEHGIMRQELMDPRIHFVLVCASVGCPYLESSAFDATHLNERLDQSGVNYLYESRRVRIDREHKIVSLPQIFKWFKEDFESGTQYKKIFTHQSSELAGLLSWVYYYANEADRDFLANNQFRISYLYYDWALNE